MAERQHQTNTHHFLKLFSNKFNVWGSVDLNRSYTLYFCALNALVRSKFKHIILKSSSTNPEIHIYDNIMRWAY